MYQLLCALDWYKSLFLQAVHMVKISRSFIKGSILYTVIGALPMASAVVLLPFYMANLSTVHFGALSIYLAFSLLIQLLVTYSYDTALYVHYHEFKGDPPKLSSFTGSAFMLMLLIGLGLFVVLSITGNYIFQWLFRNIGVSFFPNGWLSIAGGVFQAIFKVHGSLLQTREKQEAFFWSNILLFSGIVFFTITGLHFFPSSLIGPLGGRALALALGSVWVVVRIFREFGIHFNLPMLRESFDFNLYSFIYQLQQWVINYFDRVLMLLYLPMSAVGVYDFAIKCLVGVELFMNGLHSSFLPRVVKIATGQLAKSSLLEINRYYNGFIAVLMLAVCGTIFVLPLLIEWLSDYLNRPEYKLSVTLIPFIAILFLGRSVRLYFGLPYTILKYTRPLPIIYSFVSFIKIAGIILLADAMGMMGVVMASGLSVLLEILLLYSFSKKRFDFSFNKYKILAAPALLAAIIIFSESTLSVIPDTIRHLSYCALCVILLLAVYRNELRSIKLSDLVK
jgi:O-antigen/teichoic acid export membrane protein